MVTPGAGITVTPPAIELGASVVTPGAGITVTPPAIELGASVVTPGAGSAGARSVSVAVVPDGSV